MPSSLLPPRTAEERAKTRVGAKVRVRVRVRVRARARRLGCASLRCHHRQARSLLLALKLDGYCAHRTVSQSELSEMLRGYL